MASHPHTAVWIDHKEARVFHIDLEHFDEKTIASPHAHVHRHPKGAAEPHGHPDDQHRFFQDVVRALADSEQILVVGPSTAKLQLVHWLHGHDKALAPKIVGLETVDHPTDAQLIDYARRYFGKAPPRVH